MTATQVKPTLLPAGRRPVIVVSHERSGTHFLMNTLAACFDFVSSPWIDLDYMQININYFHANSLRHVLSHLAGQRVANTIKSHHNHRFFAEILPMLEGRIDILYVHRHPADVMVSFWRFLHTWPWTEGPKAETACDFAQATPMGGLMRYQFDECGTMLGRWASHVTGWTRAASRMKTLQSVRYEDLRDDYEATVRTIGRFLDVDPKRVVRPARDKNVVQRGPLPFNPAPGADDRRPVQALAETRYPELLARLGYA